VTLFHRLMSSGRQCNDPFGYARFFWSLAHQEQLTSRVKKLIRETDLLGVASISLWEIAMLVQKERITPDIPLLDWFEEAFDNPKYRLLPLSAAVATQSGSLEMHGDPADRLIVATSLVYAIPLITMDRKIHDLEYVNTIW